MTPIQACQETKELWTKLAEFSVERQKIVWKGQIPGPWEDYKHHCPCCEYNWTVQDDSQSCHRCPMKPEWNFYNISEMYCFCEAARSPYRMWTELDKDSLCIDIEFFCLLIAEMAEEAEVRLRKEGG